jgi:hypothetical protein
MGWFFHIFCFVLFLWQLSTKIHLRSIPNPNDLLFVWSYILNRITTIDHQVASRMAKNNRSIQKWYNRRSLDSNSYRNLIIHYTHEAWFATYKKYIHQLWDQIFGNAPVTNTKLIVGNGNSCNATKILIRRRPHIMLSAKK